MSTKHSTRLPLLPVTLKEAALDSPTFRGTVVQCSEQVEHIEKWLDGYLRAATRLCEGANGLEEFVNVFIQKSIPVNHLEVMLDYDYTHLAMRRFAEGSREYWNHVMGVVKRLENSVIEPLSQLQRGELRNFKEIRRQLESSQAKYDSLQSRYAAQSKSKDPSSLREDAFQLYEARKIYMKACFDFAVSAAIFRSSLDRTLTLVLTDQWREQNTLRNRGHVAMEKFNSEMTRVRTWSDTMESCERVLKKELVLQRRAIEEQLKKDTQPARDLEEYSASTVPFLTSKDMTISTSQGSERQGWLYMRSLTAKSTRAYWVRRWFFLGGGVFGYLMQGYRGGAVEESEKIGVLLCNVKAAFQEERRFCFEVKTKDTTILLQAETQADLTSWITTFEQAKRTAVNSNSIAIQASSIIPPSAPPPEVTTKDHFAHDENISMSFDRSLTLPLSGAPEKGSGGVLGTRISDGNNRKDRSLPPTPTTIGMPTSPQGYSAPSDYTGDMSPQSPVPKMTLAPNTLAGAPSPTSLMKSAAMTAALSIPESSQQPSLQKQMAQSKHKKTVSLDMDVAKERQKMQRPPTAPTLSEDEIYPPNYPQQLRAQDTQFRALFPGEPVASPVLLVFLGTWNFTDKQEISGRFYITRKTLYFYAHSLGLVYKKVMPLSSIEEVRASPGNYADHMVFHLRPKDPDDSDYEDGVGNEKALKIIITIFLEPVRLLQRRLDLLLRNEGVEANLKNTAEVLDRLVELESEPESHNAPDSESWEEVSAGHGDGRGGSEKGTAVHRPHGRSIEAPVLRDPPARLTYPTEPVLFIPPSMDKISLEKEFDIPAKALFHIMFGDKSIVFQRLYQGRRAQAIYQGPWFTLDRGKMKRDLTYEIEHHDIFRRTRRTTVVDYQTIEIKNDHLCYVITDCKTPWHLPLKDQFMLVTTIVITHVTKSKCKLSIWTAVEWSINPKFSKGMIQRQALDDLDTDALHLVDVVQTQMRKLGTENRIKNAISLFGGIGENHHEGTDSSRNLDANPSDHPNRQRVTQRSLVYMISENIVSLGKSTLSTIVMSLIAVLTTIFGVISTQRIILGLLIISASSNMMLSSRSTVAYWAERRAIRFLNDVGIRPNKMMSKAVYLKDMEDLVANGTELALVPSSECYSKFRELSTQVDYDAPANYAVDGIGYKSASTRRTAINLMRTRQNLGTYRNDLLVALRLVNSMERNIIQSEWENWLIDEAWKCKQTSFMLRQKHSAEGGEDIESVARWVRDYCQSCEVERKEWVLKGKQLRFQ